MSLRKYGVSGAARVALDKFGQVVVHPATGALFEVAKPYVKQGLSYLRSGRSKSGSKFGWTKRSKSAPARAVTTAAGQPVGMYSRSRIPIRNKWERYPTGKYPHTFASKDQGHVQVKQMTSGRYLGKFRKASKAPKYKTAQRLGCVSLQETGGQVSDKQAVYVGQTHCPFEINNSVGFAIIKAIFRKCGVEIPNLHAKLPYKCRYIIKYQDITNPGASNQLIAEGDPAGVTDTFLKFAASFVSNTTNEGVFSLTERSDEWKFSTVIFQAIDGTSAWQTLLTFHADDLKLNIHSRTTMAVQNQTNAASEGAGDDEVDLVEANPLKGYLYQTTRGQSTSMYWKPRNANEGADWKIHKDGTVLEGTYAEGVIKYKALDLKSAVAGGTGPYPAIDHEARWNKPPYGGEFSHGCKATRVHLNPGAIKKLHMSHQQTFNLNSYVKMAYPVLNVGPLAGDTFRFGYVQLLGLEKSLDDRAGTALVKVGFEKNSTSVCIAKIWNRTILTEPRYNVKDANAT